MDTVRARVRFTAPTTKADYMTRFFKRVNKSGGKRPPMKTQCWIWKGSLRTTGYGQCKPFHKGGSTLTHRISYELLRGEIPSGFILLHICDERACVNPDHLKIGTHKENTADMTAKGRGLKDRVDIQGCKNGRSILSPELVREVHTLRQIGVSRQDIADKMGVSYSTIRDILKGKTWTHVV